jgi:hypothetical protein
MYATTRAERSCRKGIKRRQKKPADTVFNLLGGSKGIAKGLSSQLCVSGGGTMKPGQ